MNKSESIGKLAAALSKAQSEFPPIPKDKEVTVKSDKGSYKFSYAPLESITSAIRPVLAANGLAFTQSVGGESLTTTILHSSGEWLQSDPIPVKVVSGSAQALGSGITYARRYSLTCAFGIVADEDDDGNTADGNHVEKSVSKVRPNIVGEETWATVTGDKKAALEALVLDLQTILSFGEDQKASRKFYEITEQEEALAVWSQLNSKERAAIKRFKPEAKE